MPQSDPFTMPWVIYLVNQLKPKSTLDIGVGNGTYGFLIRQHFDIASGRINKEQWQLRIDGIEVFEGYKNPIWDYYYDKVTIGDALQIVGEIGHYDLVFLGDVIEHFTKEDGLRLIDKLFEKTDVIIISTPFFDYPQGPLYGNIHETHLSYWGIEDFKQYFFKTIRLNTCFVIAFSKDRLLIQQIDFGDLPRLVRRAKSLKFKIKNFIAEMQYELGVYFNFRKILKHKQTSD
jgi:hypothetical protein